MKRKIYVASSWRNIIFPHVVQDLLNAGHDVYNFRNPKPGDYGFSWDEIDLGWKRWNCVEYKAALEHPTAQKGFDSDFNAMEWADTFVLVLPCGRSSHLELGWACGKGKETFILLEEIEPELMAKLADHICMSTVEILETIESTIQVPRELQSPLTHTVLPEGVEPLEDTDLMPFGKHKEDQMEKVPARYFHYFWVNGMREDFQATVPDYIRRNLEALKQEYPDEIW